MGTSCIFVNRVYCGRGVGGYLLEFFKEYWFMVGDYTHYCTIFISRGGDCWNDSRLSAISSRWINIAYGLLTGTEFAIGLLTNSTSITRRICFYSVSNYSLKPKCNLFYLRRLIYSTVQRKDF